jgi:hypothetical protein
MRAWILVCSIMVGCLAGPAKEITLARNGKARALIVQAVDATAAEQKAARELADYLQAISGTRFEVISEDRASAGGSHIFVGPTVFARSQGILAEAMEPEEWAIRSTGKDLVLAGGRPRGTLYAVYHFLEDQLGVHWWNPFEETVPHNSTLRLGPLERRGKPGLQYRDIYMLYGRDGGRFAARNRLNREGDAVLGAAYGGSRDYGPPYHVHTFNLYFPPGEYYSQHPEWYSLIDGRRVADGTQLCLTDTGLRQAFLSKLLTTIETSWAQAKAAGAPPPLVFSVSQNDCLNPCQCSRCQAIAHAEESECGPLLDFVNYLADGIKAKHPQVYLDTLAYQYTQKAPKSLRPRDNVIIRLCDTESDPTQPITSEANRAFREHLLSWAKIARNCRIWDYAVTYANPVGLPMPTAQTFGPDYRFYVQNHVEGVFTELEFEILADLRDLKVWLMMKQLEDPYAEYERLLRIFTDGFYGAAAPHVRQYLGDLQAEAARHKTRCNWNSTPASLTYLSLGFVHHAQGLFDLAERAVGKDAVRLRRVRHARLPLDRATLVLYPRLVSEWLALGQPSRLALPARPAVAQRALQTWMEQASLRLPHAELGAEEQRAKDELQRYGLAVLPQALPEKFRNLPVGTVYDYTATMTRNWGDVVKVVKDPEAETGIANRLDLTAKEVESAEKYALPMAWGLYDTGQKQGIGSHAIHSGDIPGPGYHWYRMGAFRLLPSTYVYFFWSWIIQVEVDNAYDPVAPEQLFEVWARVKFEGPRFPHTKAGDRDAIYIERVVLTARLPLHPGQ